MNNQREKIEDKILLTDDVGTIEAFGGITPDEDANDTEEEAGIPV